MGFRRALPLAIGQCALFASGLLAVMAFRAGFYANTALLVLAGLWIAADTVGRGASKAERRHFAAPGAAASPLVGAGKWRALVDQTPAPLVALQADGVVHTINRAARVLFQTDDRVIEPPADLVAGLRSPKPAESRSLTLSTPSGRRVFALQAADVADQSGNLRLGVLIDIQSEIHAAEAKALRDLLAVLSHEIMNSLTPVASLAETAAEYLEGETSPSARAAREAVVILARRARGLARFIEGYRTLARLPPPVLRRIDLGVFLGDVSEVFRASWTDLGVQLDFEGLSANLVADFDPDLLTQALLNLLTNAAEAALATNEKPRVRLSASHQLGRTEILVEDNGRGVPEAVRESIFQPFVTTKVNGAGIGLNLAHQIALSHGGDLTLLPEMPGRGATFRFTF